MEQSPGQSEALPRIPASQNPCRSVFNNPWQKLAGLNHNFGIETHSSMRLLGECCDGPSSLFFLIGQAEVECCTFADFTLSPYASIMSMDDPLHDRQSGSCSLKLAITMQALKYSKQFIGILYVESCAIIFDRIDDLRPLLEGIHFNDGMLLCG
jgi:hypothetical protein